jgi:nucleoid DNA-binding protein
MAITRREIAENLAANTNLTIKKCAELLADTLEYIINNTTDKFIITEFGTFHVSYKQARLGRNPKTLELYSIPARKTITFKRSNVLKNKIRSTQNA